MIRVILILFSALVTQASCLEVHNFTYTGTIQQFQVPQNVKRITVSLWGAGGGAGMNGSIGGPGGFTHCILEVTPNQILKVQVGQVGQSEGVHAFGGGGSSEKSGGGGGYTVIYDSDEKTVLVGAGGGGGGGGIGDPWDYHYGGGSFNGGSGGGAHGESGKGEIPFHSTYGLGGKEGISVDGKGKDAVLLSGGGGGGHLGGGAGSSKSMFDLYMIFGGGGGGSGFAGKRCIANSIRQEYSLSPTGEAPRSNEDIYPVELHPGRANDGNGFVMIRIGEALIAAVSETALDSPPTKSAQEYSINGVTSSEIAPNKKLLTGNASPRAKHLRGGAKGS